jgi:hypothetical protein
MSSDQPQAENAIQADLESVSAQTAEDSVPDLSLASEYAAQARKRQLEAAHRTRANTETRYAEAKGAGGLEKVG